MTLLNTRLYAMYNMSVMSCVVLRIAYDSDRTKCTSLIYGASSPAVCSHGQCNYKQCYTSSIQYQLGNCVFHVFSMESAWLSGLLGVTFVCFVTISHRFTASSTETIPGINIHS